MLDLSQSEQTLQLELQIVTLDRNNWLSVVLSARERLLAVRSLRTSEKATMDDH